MQNQDPDPIGQYYDPEGSFEAGDTVYTITVIISQAPVPTKMKFKAYEFPLECRCSHVERGHECTSTHCYSLNMDDSSVKCRNKYCKGHERLDGCCFGKEGVMLVE
ncbi:hypothetical protein K469DRAFT_487680, partial [Zopfia rhizophila CBS 207.26]